MKLTMRVKEFSKKITLMSTAFVLAVSTLSAAIPFIAAGQVSAVGGVINIHSLAELRTAIENQDDGQTWNVYGNAAGYGLTPFDSVTAGGQTGWYFPITADNLTVNGVGNPTIWGNGFSQNGNWSKQNFVSIFGDNVTLKNLTLMNKVQPNKVVEVIGNNSTIENVSVKANTKVDQSVYSNAMNNMTTEEARQWNGSIYYNDESTYVPATQTNHTLKNVTLNNGGVSVRAPGATVNVDGVHFIYKSNIDWINEYRFYSPVGAVINGAPQYTYQVSHALNNLDSAMKYVADPYSVQGSETIKLVSDLSLTKQMTLSKPNVTVDGAKVAGGSYTIAANFSKTDNSNNSVIGVQADGVKISNLVVDGKTTKNLHGINIYQSSNVELSNVAAINSNSGVNVNGSTVAIDGIKTSGNSWNGINVDKAGAHLTIKGANQHIDSVYAIYVDHETVGQVTDVDNQYSIMHNPADNNGYTDDRAYNLKLAAPTLSFPANNGYTTTNEFDFTWLPVQGAVSYEFQNSKTSNANNGVLSTINYSAITAEPKLRSSGAADGTVRYWQVRAVDQFGNKGDWSAPWKMTIDMSAPTAVITYSPNGPAWTKSSVIATLTASEPIDPAALTGTWLQKSPTVFQKSFPVNNVQPQVLKDLAGNTGNATIVIDWIDKVAPSASINVESEAGTGNLHRGIVEVTGVADEANVKSHWFEITNPDGSLSYSYNMNTTAKEYTFALDLSKGDGDYKLRYVTTDQAGNRSDVAGSTIRTITVDNTAPVVALNNLTTNSTSPVITGTVTDPASEVSVRVGTTLYAATNNGNGTWRLPLSGLAFGTYPITVFATDAAGNVSIESTGTLTVAEPVVAGDGENEGDGQPVVTVAANPAPQLPFAFAQPSVLGDADTNIPESDNTGAAETKGASDILAQAVDADNTNGEALGLAWYWWLLIAAGVAAFVWWIAALIRRRNAEA